MVYFYIGIANALDFTDRFLPKLELTPDSKPKIIKFLPYTKEDIIEIVKDRLKEVSCSVIEPTALIYCATKIAKSTGDIRKVLDICRFVIFKFRDSLVLHKIETLIC
jgi:cell division control protein 6